MMDATALNLSLRLSAHVAMFAFLLAAGIVVAYARDRQLKWKYWRLLASLLFLFSFWFLLLALSQRQSGLLPREALVWLLGVTETAGAVGCWIWLALTARVSFRVQRRSRPTPPPSGVYSTGD